MTEAEASESQGITGQTPPDRAATRRHSAGRDYLELTKPRIAVLVLISVAAGAYLAGQLFPDLFRWALLIHAVVGAGLVAGGASALNQVLERQTDALMPRTRNRPLPAADSPPWRQPPLGFSWDFWAPWSFGSFCQVRPAPSPRC